MTDLYHHLLVDDTRKILFCYVPKASVFMYYFSVTILPVTCDVKGKGLLKVFPGPKSKAVKGRWSPVHCI